MKITRIMMLIFAIALLATSCSTSINEYGAIIGTAFYAVPGIGSTDFKGNSSCKILETDDYGRILFSIEGYCSISGKEASALAICQKYDKYIYFYEDICYLMDSTSEEDKEALKKNNDWNLPFNEEKMARRPCKTTFDGFLQTGSSLDKNRLRELVSKQLDQSVSELKEYVILDVDFAGHELYLFVFKSEEQQLTKYFVISDSSYQINTVKITDTDTFSDDLIAFKKESGWVYHWNDK